MLQFIKCPFKICNILRYDHTSYCVAICFDSNTLFASSPDNTRSDVEKFHEICTENVFLVTIQLFCMCDLIKYDACVGDSNVLLLNGD